MSLKLNPNAAAWVPPSRRAAAPAPSEPSPAAPTPTPTSEPTLEAAPAAVEVQKEASNWEDALEDKPAEAKVDAQPAQQQPKEQSIVDKEVAEAESVTVTLDAESELQLSLKAQTKAVDPRDHLCIVFIGHVDAGKSTTSGNILYLTGQVDQRTIEKYEKEAKEKAGGSWYLAFIMDTNEEERAKGKTVEVGRAIFTTEKRRYTILDAPGHKNYVPNMIGGAACADVGILVISARINEFEAGFDKGGQTREHTMLAKTLGINRLVVAINKMDDKSVMWSKDRYDGIVGKLTPYLKQIGFAPKDVTYLPISGITGFNLVKQEAGVCDWYKGPTLIDTLDGLRPPKRDSNAALRIPVLDKLKDAGKVFIEGKVESGTLRLGQKVVIMPNKQYGTVLAISTDFDSDLGVAPCGENVRVVISGVVEENVHSGFVICDAEHPITPVPQFEAQLAITDLLDHKPIFSPGYTAVLHAHTAVEECSIKMLIGTIDKKTGALSSQRPKFVKKGGMVSARIQLNQPVCLEIYKDFPQLGRFTLRDEGKTIAIGKVTRLPQARSGKSAA